MQQIHDVSWGEAVCSCSFGRKKAPLGRGVIDWFFAARRAGQGLSLFGEPSEMRWGTCLVVGVPENLPNRAARLGARCGACADALAAVKVVGLVGTVGRVPGCGALRHENARCVRAWFRLLGCATGHACRRGYGSFWMKLPCLAFRGTVVLEDIGRKRIACGRKTKLLNHTAP